MFSKELIESLFYSNFLLQKLFLNAFSAGFNLYFYLFYFLPFLLSAMFLEIHPYTVISSLDHHSQYASTMLISWKLSLISSSSYFLSFFDLFLFFLLFFLVLLWFYPLFHLMSMTLNATNSNNINDYDDNNRFDGLYEKPCVAPNDNVKGKERMLIKAIPEHRIQSIK